MSCMLVRSQVTSGGLHLPSSAQLRAAGGVYCTYCSLYILIMLTYRVAMAQETRALLLLLWGCLTCQTIRYPSQSLFYIYLLYIYIFEWSCSFLLLLFGLLYLHTTYIIYIYIYMWSYVYNAVLLLWVVGEPSYLRLVNSQYSNQSAILTPISSLTLLNFQFWRFTLWYIYIYINSMT